MQLRAPKYYKNFKCIADKCKHSCCIGWEIDIDNKAQERYNSLSNLYGEYIRKSIIKGPLPHFHMTCNGKCVHLDNDGLCKIIKNVSEDYLCDICREHPRFYNFTNHGKEVGVGMSCESACELILSSDDFDQMEVLFNIEDNIEKYEFDAVLEREKIYPILKDSTYSFNYKINELCKIYDVSLDVDVMSIINDLEYLDENHKEYFWQFSRIDSANETFNKKLSRVLAYFIYRHCSEAFDLEEFRVCLGFSIFCTILIQGISFENTLVEMARVVSEEIEYSEDNTEKIKSLFYSC